MTDLFVSIKEKPRLMYLFEKLPGSRCEVFYPPYYSQQRATIESCCIVRGGIEIKIETDFSKQLAGMVRNE